MPARGVLLVCHREASRVVFFVIDDPSQVRPDVEQPASSIEESAGATVLWVATTERRTN